MSPTTLPSQPAAANAPPDPLGLSLLLEDAFAIVRGHPLLILGPLALLSLVTSGDGRAPSDRFQADVVLENPLVWLPFFALLGIVALAVAIALLVVFVWVGLVTTRVALTLVDGAPAPTIGAAFRETQPLLLGGIGTFLLTFLVVILGFVALVVPGFILLAAFVPLGAILVAERATGTRALRRAWALSRGHRWTLFAVLFLGALASVIASLAFAWVPLVGPPVAAAFGGAVQAFIAVLAVLYYRRTVPVAPSSMPPA